MSDLESELLREIQRMVVKNFLDTLILMKLRRGPLSGYDVIRFIQRKFHVLLSSGTIYSHLYYLERNKLIEGRWTERKRVYSLTEEGEKRVKAFLELKDKILGLIINLFLE